jgi:hypothetical protein
LRFGISGRFRLDRVLALSPVFDGSLTHITLELHPPEGTPGIIREAWIATTGHSVAINSERAFRIAAAWLQEAAQRPFEPVAEQGPGASRAPFTSADSMILRGRTARHRARILYRNTFRAEQWNVGTVPLRHEDLLRIDRLPGVRWMPAGRGLDYFADPFLARSPAGTLVLMEHFLNGSQRGEIVCTGTGGEDRVTLLGGPSHYSYPQVFEHGAQWWCVPESNDRNEVALYRFDPERRSLERTHALLENFDGVDNTLHFHEGRWWMWSTRKRHKGAGTHLFLHYSEKLEGPWQPHAHNPVKIDLTSARPAGPLFSVGGRLYRPAQDNSATYGGRVVIMEVTDLSPGRYAETVVNRIEPAPGRFGKGFHTICILDDLAAVDGKRYRFTMRPGRLGRLLGFK